MPTTKENKKKPVKENLLVDSVDTAEEKIEYMLGLCSYGSILVASTDKGLCAVFFGDHADNLITELRRQFPRAELIHGNDDFEQLLVKVIDFVEAPQTNLDIPLDIRGSNFQQSVWSALSKIPYGKTISYSELAMRIGSPNAVRAVGQACGANKLAVIIPCHRAVRLDGDLSGYRWGIQRKQLLLEKEQD